MAIQRTLSKREKITLLIFGVVLFLFLAVFARFLYTGRINVKAQIPVSKKSVSFNQQASLPTYDNRFGVVSSLLVSHDPATVDEEMTAMQQAGIKWVRCSFTWPGLESTKGQWDFSKSDMVVQKANAHGILILGILGATPSWANGGIGPPFGPAYPPTAEHMVDWQNYVTTLCNRYPTITAWEIWNEENISFWLPSPDPTGYTNLVKATYPKIKAVNPNKKVIMGGLAGPGSDYLESCLKLGIADYIDAITYHPYPETLQTPGNLVPSVMPQEATCRNLVNSQEALVAKYTNKKLEVWLTEIGWTNISNWLLGSIGVDPDTQADYLFRTWVTYADTNVDKVFYYDLWQMADDGWPVNNMGLLKHDFTPKPAYNYYKTFESVFGQAVSSNPDALSCIPTSTTTELHSFNQADGSLVAAIWKADDQNDTVTLKTNNDSYNSPIAINPLTGQEQTVTGVSIDGQGITTISNLAIGKTPVVLKFQPKTITPPSLPLLSPAAIEGLKNLILQSAVTEPANTIKYRLNTWNEGGTATNYIIKDDLTDVLKHADIVNTGGGTVTGNVITFSSVLLQPGGSSNNKNIVKEFTVKVRPDNTWPAGDTTMSNNYLGSKLDLRLNYKKVMPASLFTFNNSQKIPATVRAANPGDIIKYTLEAQNKGNLVDNNYTMQADISDILRYADMKDSGAGKLTDNMISWNISVAANSKTARNFTVQIKPAEKWPAGGNLVMSSIYGTESDIHLNPQSTGDKIVDPISRNLGPGAGAVAGTIVRILTPTGTAVLLILIIALLIAATYFLIRYLIKRRN